MIVNIADAEAEISRLIDLKFAALVPNREAADVPA